jgi:tetratricopeptide (TPR) repeat protein
MRAWLSLCLAAAAAFSLASSDPALSAADSVRYAKLRTEAGAATDPAKRLSLLEDAVKLYGQDGDLWWQLGQRRLQAKQYDSAIEAYKKALQYGAFGNKFHAGALYDIACAHSLKGEKEEAFRYLKQSMDKGFRDLQHLRTDTDLDALHSDKRWEELAATKDVSKMSRDEAWRYDLWLLHREASRIHINPYTLYLKAEQDAWVKKLHNDIPKLTDNQILASFMKYMRRLNDGHSSIRPSDHGMPRALPVQFGWFEEGFFVVAADPKQKELAGAQVLEIEDKPIFDVVKALDEIAPQDNPQTVKAMTPRYLTYPALLNGLGLAPDEGKVRLKLRMPSGDVKSVTLTADGSGPVDGWIFARNTENPPLYLKSRDKPYWFEHLPELNAVYLQYNSVRNDPAENTEAFAKRVFEFIEKNNVERLIVDVRWNGGGNSFLNRPIVNGIIGCTRVHKPGALFVIIGRNTFSAAQNFTTDLDRALDPIFVGEPTGSSPNFTGETVRFNLPYSKMQGSISDLHWQRSWPMDHRVWIAPNLPAPPRFELFKTNRDGSMEAIEAYIKATG